MSELQNIYWTSLLLGVRECSLYLSVPLNCRSLYFGTRVRSKFKLYCLQNRACSKKIKISIFDLSCIIRYETPPINDDLGP